MLSEPYEKKINEADKTLTGSDKETAKNKIYKEWSEAIDINVKGIVLLCRAMLPHFKQRGRGKIILLSGGGATKPMPFLSAS